MFFFLYSMMAASHYNSANFILFGLFILYIAALEVILFAFYLSFKIK